MLGDVNHDDKLSIKDVSDLISSLLSDGSSVCEICADVNQDGVVSIKDVTDLIGLVLSSGDAQ
jgi:hypothetical protein